jgi:2'-hydroxyisoflavone reductase
MRLLILGGTVFLGWHLAADAAARGHAVTLFHRGRTVPEGLDGIERVLGDRTRDLSALRAREWDAVIDTSGYEPEVVGRSAQELTGRAGHYTFLSTVSVYADFSRAGLDEDGLLAELPGDSTYGPLKALCERAVAERFHGPALVVRPGLIAGPRDPTDRFTYWVRRAARGGTILAPGNPNRQVQLIDVRDLARWTIDMVEGSATGVFNATGPDRRLTMGELLDTCVAVGGTPARVTWVDDQVLLGAGIEPWTDLPLWLPANDADHAGFMSIDVGRALAAGLRFRPLAETALDTLAWDRGRHGARPGPAKLSLQREAELLRAAL